jgi:mono/diheme cytochrome c family protein
MCDGRQVWILLASAYLVQAPGLASQDTAAVTAPPADTAPIYSAEQARRGQATYGKHCVNCHSASAYTGAAFRRAWGGRPAWELWEQIRTTMPQDGPGKLSPRDYADIVAYLLRLNGLPAGPTDLPADADQLKARIIRVPRTGG